VTPLIKDFEAAFPGVKVEYTDLNLDRGLQPLHQRERRQRASADAVWSSSMDLQMKLAADGLAGGLQIAGERGAARVGALQGHGVRDDVRADRDRLQQAAGACPRTCRRRTPTSPSC
jgi:hypothetical protein